MTSLTSLSKVTAITLPDALDGQQLQQLPAPQQEAQLEKLASINVRMVGMLGKVLGAVTEDLDSDSKHAQKIAPHHKFDLHQLLKLCETQPSLNITDQYDDFGLWRVVSRLNKQLFSRSDDALKKLDPSTATAATAATATEQQKQASLAEYVRSSVVLQCGTELNEIRQTSALGSHNISALMAALESGAELVKDQRDLWLLPFTERKMPKPPKFKTPKSRTVGADEGASANAIPLGSRSQSRLQDSASHMSETHSSVAAAESSGPPPADRPMRAAEPVAPPPAPPKKLNLFMAGPEQRAPPLSTSSQGPGLGRSMVNGVASERPAMRSSEPQWMTRSAGDAPAPDRSAVPPAAAAVAPSTTASTVVSDTPPSFMHPSRMAANNGAALRPMAKRPKFFL